MISRPNLSRLVIFAFMILVGLALAYAIKTHSFIGIMLALISMGAVVHFLNLLSKARRELQQEQETA